LDYLRAGNEMRTFAGITGGRAYFPRFPAEYGEDFLDIGNDNPQSVFDHLTGPNDKLEARTQN